MNRTYSYTGQCPRLEKRHTITITYGVINMCGDPQTYYKKLSYSCSQNSGCDFKDDYGQCPVYLAAPEDPS